MIILTPSYYKRLYKTDVDKLDNQNHTVPYILKSFDHGNQIDPYKPPADKRSAANLADTSYMNDAVKKPKYTDSYQQTSIADRCGSK